MEPANKQALESYQINCKACCGLCCVALYFSKTDGFPYDKISGIPCDHLCDNYTCDSHKELSHHGWRGCMAYDCFGAGPFITKKLSDKPNWKTLGSTKAEMIFNAYRNVMQIHQTMWYLHQAISLVLDDDMNKKLRCSILEGHKILSQPLHQLSVMDITVFRIKSNKLLKQICTLQKPLQINRNFAGKNFKQQDLSELDFSMSLLIASNLESAKLRKTNFLGADMRDANIQNTDLTDSLFLTQFQINSTHGNKHTKLPCYLKAPASWK